ncbi:MAG: hypothetical protein LBS96_06195 [Oscillospiraceae bacterium]|jgi:hypothetical protein|nr:hypothetical protein [Oscillospiraceae bacterium]
MKTKRILSALLALLAFAGLFTVGASAAWVAPEGAQTLSVKTAGWGYKEVSWAITGNVAEFLAAVEAKEATYEWLVVNAKGATIPVKAENGLADLRDATAGKLVLVLTPGKIKNYGTFTVTLNLNGTPSQSVSVTLVDDTALVAAIAAAKAVAANPDDRYAEAFIAGVNEAIAAAEALLPSETITAEIAAAAVAALEAAISPKEYKLSGVAFLDDFLASRIEGLWNAYDAIAAPFQRLNELNWSSITTLIVNTFIAIFTIGY